jgi:hypothetical protein
MKKMEKILLSAIAVMAFGIAAQGQTRFGVKLGSNIATLAGADGVTPKLGLHIGGVVEFKFSEKFSLQPELLYSMQGATSSADSGYDIQFDYLNVPVIAKYYVIPGLSIEAGPQFGVAVKLEDSEGTDLELTHETIDYGVNVGAGYELPFGMFFQARYYAGLMNISLKDDYKNSVLQFSVGYKF